MSVVTTVINDLRERRLWPFALALVAALVAVPVLLTKKATTAPAQPAAGATAAIPPAAGLPVVNVTAAPSESRLTGPSRDPFTQQQRAAAAAMTSSAGPTATASTSSTSSGASGSSGTSSGSSNSSGGSGQSSSGSSSSGSSGTSTTPTGTTTTPTTTPPGGPKTTPPGLSPTEAYDVVFAITNSSGGFNTIDPLQRLSVLPGAHQPLLVELGVLKGGHRVLFAVQPGTVVSGPGTCTPGPIDCEVLSIAPNQIEGLSMRTSAGVDPVALFAVTAIKVQKYSSRAAANKYRRSASAAGRRLLRSSPLGALSLFEYENNLGALVDQRNVTVGSS